MFLKMYQGKDAFWKCVLVVATGFGILQYGLHSDHIFHLIPNDSYEGYAAFTAIVVWQTWCATSLYECAYNARFAVIRVLGKACGVAIYFVTTYVFVEAAIRGDFFWGIIGILYGVWALYKMLWED